MSEFRSAMGAAEKRFHANGEAPPSFRTAAEQAPEDVMWLAYPYLPAGQIALLAGKGGQGKGLIAMSLAAAVTNGADFLGCDIERGAVLWCETEDPEASVLVPRLMAAGADRDRVFFAKPDEFAAVMPSLRRTIENQRTRLIVMSPLVSFLEGFEDGAGDKRVRSVLEDLQAAIEGLDCALLGITHLNKKPDLSAIERVLGSVAFVNYVRSVLIVGPAPETEDSEDRSFAIVHEKSNLGPRGDPWHYTIRHVGENPRSQFVRVDWTPAPEDIEADSLYRARGDNRSATAGQWLVRYLRKHGESLRANVISAAEREGYSESAIRKAQERNPSIQSRQDEWHGPYIWSLQ